MYVTDVDAYACYLRTLLTDRVLFTFMVSFFSSNTASDDVIRVLFTFMLSFLPYNTTSDDVIGECSQ